MSDGMQPGATPEPVDPKMIDAQFQQLEAEAQQLEAAIQKFGHKLQAAAMNGDHGAKAWLSELRLIAMQVRQEQSQMHTLLQAMHGFTAHALHQLDLAQAAGAGGGGQVGGGQAGGGLGMPGGSPQPQVQPQAQAGQQYAPAPQAPQAGPSSLPVSGFPGQPQPQAPYAQGSQLNAQLAQDYPADFSQQDMSQEQGGGLRSKLGGLGAAGGGAIAGIAGMLGMRRPGGTARSSNPGMRAPMGTRGAMFGMRGANSNRGGFSGAGMNTADDTSNAGGRYGGGFGFGRSGGFGAGGGGYGAGGGGGAGGGIVQGGNAHSFMSGRMGSMMKKGPVWGMEEEVVPKI
jgi:hypothetical protein